MRLFKCRMQNNEDAVGDGTLDVPNRNGKITTLLFLPEGLINE